MKKKRVKLLLADDHPVVLEGLKSVIKACAPEAVVAGVALDGRETLAAARRLSPDICVLDISMPRLNGLQVMAALRRAAPDCRVVVVSMHDDKPTVEKALAAGAKGYLVKDSAAEELVAAVRAVSRGDCYLSRTLCRHFEFYGELPNWDFLSGKRTSLLSAKQREVVSLLAEGLSNKEIAKRLRLSTATVLVHRRNISFRLGIRKQTDLVRYAIREGLARP